MCSIHVKACDPCRCWLFAASLRNNGLPYDIYCCSVLGQSTCHKIRSEKICFLQLWGGAGADPGVGSREGRIPPPFCHRNAIHLSLALEALKSLYHCHASPAPFKKSWIRSWGGGVKMKVCYQSWCQRYCKYFVVLGFNEPEYLF